MFTMSTMYMYFYNFRPCRLPALQSHLLMKSLWISLSWICIKKKTSYFIDGAKQDNILTTAFKAQKGGAALEEEVVDLQLQVREQRSMLWAAPLFNFWQPHTIHASTELDGPRAWPRGSQSGRGFFFFLTPFDPSLSSLSPATLSCSCTNSYNCALGR